MSQMMEAALAGDIKKANELHYKMFELMKLMFIEPNPVPAKKALELLGRIRSGLPRLPLAPMGGANLEKLQAAMRNIGLL
jgi:4-hydroxy-tetrahydrodipicolinate synthase